MVYREKHEKKEEQAEPYPYFGVDETTEYTELLQEVNKCFYGGINYILE